MGKRKYYVKSYKIAYGRENVYWVGKYETLGEAKKALNTEEYGFRTRETITKREYEKLHKEGYRSRDGN